jgi:hypothetical protein
MRLLVRLHHELEQLIVWWEVLLDHAGLQTTWPCQSQSRTYVSANVISDVTVTAADGEMCDSNLTDRLLK